MIAYWRIWCLGPCASYRRASSEPLLCTKCGGEVIAVPVSRELLAREGKR